VKRWGVGGERRLLDTVASNLQLVIPSQAAAVTLQVEILLPPASRPAVRDRRRQP
jgi:hypothetical protein